MKFALSRLSKLQLGGVLLLVLFLTGRLFLLFNGEVTEFPDSGSYRPEPGRPSAIPLISFTGDAHRLWGVPLFYGMLPTDALRIAGQWLVATVSWALLAWAIWRRLYTAAAKLAGAGLILGLALLTPVTNWDFALLSESLSISFGVLSFACFLLWRETGHWLPVTVMTVATVWWMFTRLEIVVFAVPLALALAWAAWRQITVKRERVAALAALAVILGAVGWSATINAALERRPWGPYSAGGSPSEEVMIYKLGLVVYQDQEVERTFSTKLGMPDCPGLAAQARAKWDIRAIPAEYRKCPELKQWAKQNAQTIAIRFAVAAPSQYVRVTEPVVMAMLNGHVYGKAPLTPPLLFSPPFHRAWMGAFMALLVAGAGLFLGLRYRVPLTKVAAAVMLAGSASLLVSVALTGGEFARMGIQEAVALRLGGILLVVAGIEAVVRRRIRA